MTTDNYDLFNTGDSDTLILVIDRTQSMINVIDTLSKLFAKYLIRYIGDTDKKIKRLGLIGVDDHYNVIRYESRNNPGTYVDYIDRASEEHKHRRVQYGISKFGPYLNYGLTENLEEFMYWLTTMPIGFGEDSAEAYACSIHAALRLDPNASVWVIGDAVPHGFVRNQNAAYKHAESIYGLDTNEQSVLSRWTDNEKQGCPCGTRMPSIKRANIKVAFINEKPNLVIHGKAKAYIWEQVLKYPTLFINGIHSLQAQLTGDEVEPEPQPRIHITPSPSYTFGVWQDERNDLLKMRASELIRDFRLGYR